MDEGINEMVTFLSAKSNVDVCVRDPAARGGRGSRANGGKRRYRETVIVRGGKREGFRW
jgi:hypothetical protein